jgi:hypothetical protein
MQFPLQTPTLALDAHTVINAADHVFGETDGQGRIEFRCAHGRLAVRTRYGRRRGRCGWS